MFLRITASQFADLIKKSGYDPKFSYDNTKALYDYLEERHAGEFEFDIDEICMYFKELSLAEANTLFDLSLYHDDDPQDIRDCIERSGGIVVSIDTTDKDNFRILINVS